MVWEAVGGEMLATGVHALARGGRLVVIGAVSQYAAGWAPSTLPPGTPELLLWRSATITGAVPCELSCFAACLNRVLLAGYPVRCRMARASPSSAPKLGHSHLAKSLILCLLSNMWSAGC